MGDCVLCFSPIVMYSDRNLVQGRGELKVDEENLSLEFAAQLPWLPGIKFRIATQAVAYKISMIRRKSRK